MTQLARAALKPLYRAANSAHPGLLLQRGWTDFVRTDAQNAGSTGKTEHIERICRIPAPGFYERAYDRWLAATGKSTRFSRLIMNVEGRLLIGLSSGSSLETGCTVAHTHGMPMLPGSSIKGVVRAWAESNMPDWQSQFNELFGTHELSGLIAFHDAWWVPDSGAAGHKNAPFVADIVTPHHPDYYAGKGPATDLDSPVPNSLLGVRGSFLFVLEGDKGWRELAARMLARALAQRGIGAKTSAGYGRLVLDREANSRLDNLARQAMIAALSPEERYQEEIAGMTEKKVAEAFGTDLNATRERLGDDFPLYARIAQDLHRGLIDSWQGETKKTNKARFRTYRFFNGGPLEH
ncbi:type III-B CRISPR module RAMP protein Cmr6 [Azonexus sp.]|uniref:type III-B CRISPR module RAMP protein Cmr6 n=1 Tax=Azonexus sp. TaxID=1872668 RepID=UPI0035AE8531